MIKKITCTICPIGCKLEVDIEKNTVTGHTCKRGEVYGIAEVTAPTRVITSTVKLEGGIYPVLPVKTNGAIPKHLNFKCMELINQIQVKAPVKMGDIIAENVLDTGVDLVATRSIKKG